MRIKRKTLYRILETTALSLVALDLIAYLAVARPLASSVSVEQEKFSESRQQVRLSEARIRLYQKELAELPATEREMKTFLEEHVPPRRRGYSRVSGLVHKLTQDSNVQMEQLAYRLELEPKDPLQRLEFQVKVTGPFEALLRFTHALETSSELVLVRGLIFQPGETQGLGLRLLADAYVTP
jgi:Tfp pilus assembly protein PilO